MSDDVVLTWVLATPDGKPYTTTVPRELWEEQDQAALVNQLGAGLLDHMWTANGRGAVVLKATVNEGRARQGEESTVLSPGQVPPEVARRYPPEFIERLNQPRQRPGEEPTT